MGLRLMDTPVLGQYGFTAQELDDWFIQLSGDDADLLYETESIEVLDAAYNPGGIVTDEMILDAVSAKYNRFPRTMQALARVLARHAGDIEVLQPVIGKPRRAGGISTVTAQFPFGDGQAVSVVFHAPGANGRISNNDDLIAYRWLLNKRDITVAVAPEMTRGEMRDIPLQTVAKRVMQLVSKNSDKFRSQQDRVQKQRKLAEEAEQLVEQLSTRENQLQLEIQALQDDTEEKQVKTSQLELKLRKLKTINNGLAKIAPTKAGSLEQTIRAQDMDISARLEVVPVSSLITSDMEQFDQKLQPRDRTRESSNQQIQEIIRQFDPNQLLAAPTADTGAPIVSSDNFVESGNGRTMALRKVAEDQLLHRKYAKAVEAATGLRVREGEVLIRRRTSDLNEEDRAAFTVKANNMNIASMSATERGLADAALIDDGMLASLKNTDFNQLSNADFVRGFLGKLSANDRGALVDEDEQLSQTGVQRLRNALLAAAYSNPGTMARITESTDDNVKSISGALVDAAPMIARLKRDVEAGRVKPEFDISDQIAEAAGKVSQARAKGTAISDLLSQADIFADPDPITDELIKSFYNETLTRAVGRDKIADTLIRYADQSRNETVEGNLFGDSIDPEQILADLNEKRNASQNQNGLFDSANQFFLHPLHDGMRLSRERTQEGEFSPAVLWATMGMLEAGDGSSLLTEPESMAVLDAAYNAGQTDVDMVLDAVSSEYGARLPRSLKALQRAFNRQLSDSLKIPTVKGNVPEEYQPIVGNPRRAGGFATVTAQFPFPDGQTISVVFHAPGADGRISNGDELIAYRWLLNKRDITVAVAPEMTRGEMRDIPLRTVARRVTQLLEANSGKFTARQTKASEEQNALETAEKQVETLTETVTGLNQEISDLEQSENLNPDFKSLRGELEMVENENKELRQKISATKQQEKQKEIMPQKKGNPLRGLSAKHRGLFEHWKMHGGLIDSQKEDGVWYIAVDHPQGTEESFELLDDAAEHIEELIAPDIFNKFRDKMRAAKSAEFIKGSRVPKGWERSLYAGDVLYETPFVYPDDLYHYSPSEKIGIGGAGTGNFSVSPTVGFPDIKKPYSVYVGEGNPIGRGGREVYVSDWKEAKTAIENYIQKNMISFAEAERKLDPEGAEKVADEVKPVAAKPPEDTAALLQKKVSELLDSMKNYPEKFQPFWEFVTSEKSPFWNDETKEVDFRRLNSALGDRFPELARKPSALAMHKLEVKGALERIWTNQTGRNIHGETAKDIEARIQSRDRQIAKEKQRQVEEDQQLLAYMLNPAESLYDQVEQAVNVWWLHDEQRQSLERLEWMIESEYRRRGIISEYASPDVAEEKRIAALAVVLQTAAAKQMVAEERAATARDSTETIRQESGLNIKGLAKTWHDLSQGMTTGEVKPERAIELSRKFEKDRLKLSKSLSRVSQAALNQMLDAPLTFKSGVNLSDKKTLNIEALLREIRGKIKALNQKAEELLSDPDYTPEINQKNSVIGLSENHAEWAQSLVDRIKKDSYSGSRAALLYSDPKHAVIHYAGLDYAMRYPDSVNAANQRDDLIQPHKNGWAGDEIPKVLFPLFLLKADDKWPKSVLRQMNKAAKSLSDLMAQEKSQEAEVELENGYKAFNVGIPASPAWRIRLPDGEDADLWRDENGKVKGIYDSIADAIIALRNGSYIPTDEDRVRMDESRAERRKSYETPKKEAKSPGRKFG